MPGTFPSSFWRSNLEFERSDFYNSSLHGCPINSLLLFTDSVNSPNEKEKRQCESDFVMTFARYYCGLNCKELGPGI